MIAIRKEIHCNMSTSTSLNDTSTSSCQGEDHSSNKKVSTSCDQKVEICNNDSVSNLILQAIVLLVSILYRRVLVE